MASSKVMQYIGATGATMGGFCLGTVIGWCSPAISQMENFGFNEDQIYWIGSIMPVGAILVLILLFFIFDLCGRRWIMIGMALPFLIAWIILAFCEQFALIMLGRLLCGFCGASFCVTAPTFTGEIAEKEIRGTLGVLFQLFITIGILLAYCLGEADDIKILTIPNCIFPILCCVILIFMAESPVYYLKKGNEEKARKSLQFYRGKNYDVGGELAEMMAYTREGSETFWEAFKKKSTIKAFLMLMGLHAVQQLSGINAVMFYCHDIFRMAGSSLESGISSIIVGVVQVLCTFLSAVLVDRIGRKILWLVSLTLMGICLLLLGIYFMIKDNDESTAKSLGWLPLLSLCVYIVGFSLGAGPLPWAMLGEVLPNRVKGTIGSVVGCFNWFLAFVVTVSFGFLVRLLTAAVVFWIFGIICALGFAFVVFCVIETKGKTLDEIQTELGG